MKKELFVIGEGFKVERKTVSKKKALKKKGLFALEYVNLGWYIIIPILLFLTLGILISRVLKLGKWVVVLFIFLGVGSSFYNIFKIWKKLA